MYSTLVFTVALSAFVFSTVRGESHTIEFVNKCGFGTPRLIKGNDILTSTSHTIDGPFSSGIAYLDTDDCTGFNGEGCTLVEMSLQNPTVPGSGSSVDISLIAPLKFSVPTSFEYFNGCDGQGTSCTSADCNTAFFKPDDTFVQVACQANNVNLRITFCGDGTSSEPASTTKKSSTTVVKATSTEKEQHSTAAASPTIPAKAAAVTAHPASSSTSSTAKSATSSSSSSAGKCSRSRKERRALASQNDTSTPSRRGVRWHRHPVRHGAFKQH